jgi:[ribosomal protein S5]-alanine N-acetyltransferase
VRSIDQSPESLLFGIFLLTTGDHIGNIKISGVDFKHGSGEIGYLIGNHHVWGRGYATEAIGGMAEFAFSVLKLKRLTAGAYPANLGSIRVLEKCGFKKVESKLSRLEGGGQEIEVFRFALMKPM